MKKNMHGLDRKIRILIALIIATLYLTNILQGTLAYILLGVSVVFVITSFINFCPLYSVLGINTCKIKS